MRDSRSPRREQEVREMQNEEYRYCQCDDPEPRDAVPPEHPQYPIKECGKCGGEL